jgi:predicted DNA-binding transcriptional regulator AlpA
MADRRVILGERPPSFVSKATLAAELDMSESTVDSYVQRGLLPKPIRRAGSVRWYWPHVEAAMLSAGAAQDGDDPFMQGVDHV